MLAQSSLVPGNFLVSTMCKYNRVPPLNPMALHNITNSAYSLVLLLSIFVLSIESSGTRPFLYIYGNFKSVVFEKIPFQCKSKPHLNWHIWSLNFTNPLNLFIVFILCLMPSKCNFIVTSFNLACYNCYWHNYSIDFLLRTWGRMHCSE